MVSLAPMIRTALTVFVLDQFTKLYVLYALDLKNIFFIEIWDPYLLLRMAWNEGINFGIKLGNKWILLTLALAICAWIAWWMARERPGPWVQASAGLVLGGAISNVVDRAIYGAVADFLNMSCCGWENPWSFNVADIAIFAGALGLIFLTGGEKPQTPPASDEP